MLGIYLEVLSMQLTPTLRLGTIRARPASSLVSLHATRSGGPAETAFQMAEIKLNRDGGIGSIRVAPTREAFQPLPTRNAVEIGALAVVPADSLSAMQLTPSHGAPMMMHLLARFSIGGVELTPGLTLSRLVLNSRSNTVRVTLNPNAPGPEQGGVFCEVATIHLDSSSRLVELSLKPLK